MSFLCWLISIFVQLFSYNAIMNERCFMLSDCGCDLTQMVRTRTLVTATEMKWSGLLPF